MIPINSLLGSKGHEHCEGFQLADDARTAKAERKAWAGARRDWLRQHGNLDDFTVQPPRTGRINTFAGGSIEFHLRPVVTRNGSTIDTDRDLRKFTCEMRSVLEGHTDGLPDAIFEAASYDYGSDGKFLTRLWTDFYPGEPVPAKPSSDPT